MEEIELSEFGGMFRPISALLVYESTTEDVDHKFYVEHLDIDVEGRPCNAHPLSEQDATGLIYALNTSQVKREKYLRPISILPSNVLYIDSDGDGSVIWHSRIMEVPLYFTDSLGIENGLAFIPPLLWKVKGHRLSVFALKSDRRPNQGTKLYKAPFFNIDSDGLVCMGSVDTEISEQLCLEDFIAKWQDFFFNSRFSHLLGEGSPIKGNCVQLWKELVGTGKPFPLEILKIQQCKIDDLLKS